MRPVRALNFGSRWRGQGMSLKIWGDRIEHMKRSAGSLILGGLMVF